MKIRNYHVRRDVREKVQALSLAKDCYGMKLKLLTNAIVVDDAMRFVSANIRQDEDTKVNRNRKEVKAYDNAEAERTNEDSNHSYNTTF